MSLVEEPIECKNCGGKIAYVAGIWIELDHQGLPLDVEHECGSEANVSWR